MWQVEQQSGLRASEVNAEELRVPGFEAASLETRLVYERHVCECDAESPVPAVVVPRQGFKQTL